MQFGISLIGAGRLGGALAIALSRSGLEIVNVTSRTAESAQEIAHQIRPTPNSFAATQIEIVDFAKIVLIATPDPEIEMTAAKLVNNKNLAGRNTVFLHTSGALSSAILSNLRKVGGSIGSLHPLISVSDAQAGAHKFRGAYFCLEGDSAAVEFAQKIVDKLAGRSFSIPTENKILYHAAAVLSAGHLVALFDVARETLTECGLGAAEAQQILLPLVKSTIDNLSAQTPPKALTGTFARADAETMKKHLYSLEGKAAQAVYAELGKRSLRLAKEQGADPEKLKEMAQIIEDTIKK